MRGLTRAGKRLATTAHACRFGHPWRLLLQQGQFLGGGVPALQPVEITVQIGMDQLQFGGTQATQLQLMGHGLTQTTGAVSLLQRQGQALQQFGVAKGVLEPISHPCPYR